MSQTDVNICNISLLSVNSELITSLDDDNDSAKACKILFPFTRDTVLRAHPWNFALKRVEIAEETTAPLYEFEHSYVRLPDDLRVLQVNDRKIKFKVEGRKIITDEVSPIKIKYIGQITDPNQFDELYTESLSLLLGSKLAVTLNQNDTLSKSLQDQYLVSLSKARSVSGQEGTQDGFEDRTLLDARA